MLNVINVLSLKSHLFPISFNQYYSNTNHMKFAHVQMCKLWNVQDVNCKVHIVLVLTSWKREPPVIEVSLFPLWSQIWNKEPGVLLYLCLFLELEIDPPIFHFYLSDSIYQRRLDKNKICNLSLSMAKPPRRTGLPGGWLGQISDCIVIKGPLATWQTVPQAPDDRPFQDRQGEKIWNLNSSWQTN